MRGAERIGDLALGDDGKPSIHIHVVLGLGDGSTRGSHLLDGLVQPTLEVTLVEMPTHLRRRTRPELGIALIDLAASAEFAAARPNWRRNSPGTNSCHREF